METPANAGLEKVRLLVDFFHRAAMHHALWYAEVVHQFGREKAFEIMEKVIDTTYEIQIQRLAKVMGFELSDGQPTFLLNLPQENLDRLIQAVAVNWLANDGVWFQAIEKDLGMYDAKRCNDSCWGQFSPFEAASIKRVFKLEEQPGLDGLKFALTKRLYAFINTQSFAEETPNSFVFRMNDCRVQSARKRKGMEDYPCKSGGMIEYRSFAETIDKRIKTECIACPPDAHPEEWYCAWRFTID